ncbi:MAG: 50S ribosomal protein L7ae-like protein [Clostridiales bacterium]|nr:MAG: 50S ribosomal protein L7ae-like protein [Clostridiales bacterium]
MLKCAKVGVKQSQKALDMGYALEVYVAKDAQEYVVRHVLETAEQKGVPIKWIDSMETLGNMFKIDVGAATAVITK